MVDTIAGDKAIISIPANDQVQLKNSNSMSEQVNGLEESSPESSPDSIPPQYNRLVSRLKNIDGPSSCPSEIQTNAVSVNRRSSVEFDQNAEKLYSKNMHQILGRDSKRLQGSNQGANLPLSS